MFMRGLIHSEGNPVCLPGERSFTSDQIHVGHKQVTPVYDESGEVNSLEITPQASMGDICAVLFSCGIQVDALVDQLDLDPLGRTLRYEIVDEPEIGPGAISLQLMQSAENISW